MESAILVPISSIPMIELTRFSSGGRLTMENIMPKETIHTRAPRATISLVHQPRRRQEWNGLSAQEILARHRIGKTPPLKVLELLIDLFNKQHTARQKEVSFKTRQERAEFLRRKT